MSYIDDIIALGADHIWAFDNNFVSSLGGANGVSSGMEIGGVALCEDVSGSVFCDTASDRITIPNTNNINMNAQSRKILAGWFMTTAVQTPPIRVVGDGAIDNAFQLAMGMGNNIMLDCLIDGVGNFQIYGPILIPNRAYHICVIFEGSNFENEIKLFIDGVEQFSANPSNRRVNTSVIPPNRPQLVFGNPSNAVSVGGVEVIQASAINAHYNMWAHWENTTLTDTDIRVDLFEKGALPEITITSSTAANMQAQLNAISNTVRGNSPLNIRIEPVSGDGNLTLNANNIKHDPLASCHIQYTGTGRLTWINSNGSNASIISTINGGNVNIVNPAILTLSPLVVGTEVRVFESGTTNEIDGIENSLDSFSTSILSNNVDIMIHNVQYKNIRIENVDMSQGDISLPIAQRFDRQYENLNQ